ncbi:PqqD family protein [Bacteroides sp.]|uniref:PqqD family protein n=1 Tax=Bacteroides sp. TaxID=29523 RepID=UPI00260392A3|nr:PqqD family protein [Bacteroides sp.]MDD3039898.1 PqqD family protein [Bacteroides sp.]
MKIIEGFKLRRIGTEYIVTGEGLGQVDFNQMIGMNASAAYLWQQVENKDFDTDTLASLLTEHYEVDEATARADAQEILQNWADARIIE